jgi:hypothetical protein
MEVSGSGGLLVGDVGISREFIFTRPATEYPFMPEIDHVNGITLFLAKWGFYGELRNTGRVLLLFYVSNDISQGGGYDPQVEIL